MNNIEPRNSKNQYHGYQEWYCYDKLILKSNYKNDKPIGYGEYHTAKKIYFNIR